jgi:hypothetical protein
MSKFKKGDKAKVIGNRGPNHSFPMGTIVEITQEADREGYVKARGLAKFTSCSGTRTDTVTLWVSERDLELVSSPAPEFRIDGQRVTVGDTVRVKEGLIHLKSYDGIPFNKDMGKYFGLIAEVTEVLDAKRVRLNLYKDTYESWVFSPSMLELGEYQEGDFVKVRKDLEVDEEYGVDDVEYTYDHEEFAGKVVEIDYTSCCDETFTIAEDDEGIEFNAEMVEPATYAEIQKKKEAKSYNQKASDFKAGDKVKLLEKHHYIGYEIGEVVTVRDIDTSNNYLECENSKGTPQTIDLARAKVEKVQDDSTIKAGDKVRIISEAGHNFKKGQIVTFKENDGSYGTLSGYVSNWPNPRNSTQSV